MTIIQEKKDRSWPLNEVAKNKKPRFQPIYPIKPLRRNLNYIFHEQKFVPMIIFLFIVNFVINNSNVDDQMNK